MTGGYAGEQAEYVRVPLADKTHVNVDKIPFVVTHSASLDEGPSLYKTFRDKADGCIKVVLEP